MSCERTPGLLMVWKMLIEEGLRMVPPVLGYGQVLVLVQGRGQALIAAGPCAGAGLRQRLEGELDLDRPG